MKTISCKRFTLIEMLVVIAIISILAGLVFPALGLARQNAKKSKANSECQSLKTAIIMYESEFSCWPATTSSESEPISDYVDMCRYLTCSNENKKNGKNMVFFEVGVGYKDSQGILDPWGNQYQVILDADFDGRLKSEGTVETLAKMNNNTSQYIPTRVIVFSYGVDRSKDNSSVSNLAANKKLVVAM